MRTSGTGRDQPVQAKLTHRFQDVHLPRLPQLLAADAAGDEAARPPDTSTGRTGHRAGGTTEDSNLHFLLLRADT